jgi:hypothetical protein
MSSWSSRTNDIYDLRGFESYQAICFLSFAARLLSGLTRESYLIMFYQTTARLFQPTSTCNYPHPKMESAAAMDDALKQ